MAHEHAAHSTHPIVPGFGADRAAHYDAQAPISLAGYDAMYELGACALATRLRGHDEASLLYIGLGTGAELMHLKRLEVPGWRFTGVDPSAAMLDVARERLTAEGMIARAQLHVGELRSLPAGPGFDGAQMLGVLHHVPGEQDRVELLREVARRLRPGAPLVLGCRVGIDAAVTEIELRRLQAYGFQPDALTHRREAMTTVRPIESEAALFAMFAEAGLVAPRQIFASLLYRVFLVERAPDDPRASSTL